MKLHIFHKWAKWQITLRGDRTELDDFDKEVIIGTFIKQERECEECGKIQARKIRF